MKRAAFSLLRYALVAGALVGAYYSAVFARARYLFQQDTARSVAAAVNLVPYNASYVARLAAWQPENKKALLQRAIELNPFDYESWIQLGLSAEMEERNFALAEHDYLRAAEVNHMFQPKWTLTNFYFRHEQAEKFFLWAKATLQISPYQADPVFTQMWLMSQDGRRIAAALPDRPTVLLQYIIFLTRTGQFVDVPPVIDRVVHLVGQGAPADFGRDDQILPAEDRILAAGQLGPALDVWQKMVHAGWLSLSVPSFGLPLTNGDFAKPVLGRGFDWVLATPKGITIEQANTEKKLTLSFAGDEPEQCVLIQQYVPLSPNHDYHLRWQASAQAMDAPSGIAWHIHSVRGSAPAELDGVDILAGTSEGWDFRSPENAEVFLLTLEYSRPLGKVLTNGTVELRQVFLQEK